MRQLVVREGDVLLPLAPITAGPVAGTIIPRPVPLPGSAGFLVEGHLACVPSDIEGLVIPGIGYSAAAFVGGFGELRFRVPRPNRARYARTRNGMEVVVDGGLLELTFKPTLRATDPSGVQDPTPEYAGTARLTCVRVRPVTAGPAA
ncbi:hypothetical protein OHS33_31345 [Streptomyces sp. NBC_00536]|uniref:hypothetical protein n=1 Tax=Streptomyces sp. NBC_00536 TaxID=2975769 RepID=UPI002E82330B|nr:hypothetical protein [Streptomyces sp. NBC_00536]WUC82457.1 hypothetical protein OHS33_31345 [Streptomyces sp. NBC_00536]